MDGTILRISPSPSHSGDSECSRWLCLLQHINILGLRLVKITGGPARMGLRSRWSWPRPRAEILPPKCHLCPRLRWLGQHGFFFRMHIVNLRPPLPKKVDRSQIASRCQCIWPSWPPFSRHFSHIFSILIMVTSESHRLSQFLERRQPPFFTETLDSYNHYNYKRGIRSTTLSKGGGMESRWIGSCRHRPSYHQSGLRCANIPSLVNKFLTHL
jgi:hypothetical protein